MPYKDPAKTRANVLRWQKENRERHNANVRKYDKANPEKRRAKVNAYAARNRERLRLKQIKYWNSHRAEYKVAMSRRRTRIRGNGGSHTAAEWISLCWSSGWRCFYCGTGPLTEKTAVQEHKIPVVRGGSDAIGNIAVACAPCNRRKHTMTDTEFLERCLLRRQG